MDIHSELKVQILVIGQKIVLLCMGSGGEKRYLELLVKTKSMVIKVVNIPFDLTLMGDIVIYTMLKFNRI